MSDFLGNVFRYPDPVAAFNKYERKRARKVFRVWCRLGKITVDEYETLTNPTDRQGIDAFSRKATWLAGQAEITMWFGWRPLWWRRRQEAR